MARGIPAKPIFGDKMKTQEILELDCRDEDNKVVLMKVLKTIKPLQRFKKTETDVSEIPQWALEKVLHSTCRKYNVNVVGIQHDPLSNKDSDIWSGMIMGRKFKKFVYGLSIYELLAKFVVAIYGGIKNNEIHRRDKM